jgi:hypothetical protein
MRIGDTIQAGLNAYDPSPYLRAQGNATQSIGAGIAQGIGAAGDAVKDRRQKKDTIKTSKELAQAMSKLYPESAEAMQPIIDQLDNEEMPLSERSALGAQIGEFINMGVQKSRDNALLGLEKDRIEIARRSATVAERGMDNEEERQRYDTEALDRALETQTQTEAVVGPAVLDALVAQAQSDKAAGRTGGMAVEQLQAALDSPPSVQMNIAKAAMAMRPEGSELRDVKFTQDGVAMTGTGVYDQRTGRLKVLPVEVPGVAYGDGSGGDTLPEMTQVEIDTLNAQALDNEVAAAEAGMVLPPKVTAGAPIAAPPKPQTETQKKLDEMALAKAEGEIAKEVTTLSGAKTNAEAAIVVMDNLVKHPGFEAAVGSGFSKTLLRQDEAIRGSDRAGAEAMIAQLKGQAFLNAIQQLRGLGALSDAEGAKLQQAAARLDPNQKESDFKAALAEYRAIVQKGVDDAAAILAKKAGSAPAAGSPAPAGSTAPAADPAAAAAAQRAADAQRLRDMNRR